METVDTGITKSLDEALDEYLDSALEKIDKVINLLHEAEVAYTLSKAHEDKRKKDVYRSKGTIYLEQAKELLLK